MQLTNYYGDGLVQIASSASLHNLYYVESPRLPQGRWQLRTPAAAAPALRDVQWRDARSVIAICDGPDTPCLREWIGNPAGTEYASTVLAEGVYTDLRAGNGNWLARAADGRWAGVLWGDWHDLGEGVEVSAIGEDGTVRYFRDGDEYLIVAPIAGEDHAGAHYLIPALPDRTADVPPAPLHPLPADDVHQPATVEDLGAMTVAIGQLLGQLGRQVNAHTMEALQPVASRTELETVAHDLAVGIGRLVSRTERLQVRIGALEDSAFVGTVDLPWFGTRTIQLAPVRRRDNGGDKESL